MAGTVFQNDFLQLIYNAVTIAGLARDDAAPLGNLYVALHSATPGDAGDQTTNEIAYTGYARKAVARTAAGWTVATNTVSNTAAVVFGACTALSAVATHFSIGTDLAGAGKILHYGALTASYPISAGITPTFAIGKITVTISTA